MGGWELKQRLCELGGRRTTNPLAPSLGPRATQYDLVCAAPVPRYLSQPVSQYPSKSESLNLDLFSDMHRRRFQFELMVMLNDP